LTQPPRATSRCGVQRLAPFFCPRFLRQAMSRYSHPISPRSFPPAPPPLLRPTLGVRGFAPVAAPLLKACLHVSPPAPLFLRRAPFVRTWFPPASLWLTGAAPVHSPEESPPPLARTVRPTPLPVGLDPFLPVWLTDPP